MKNNRKLARQIEFIGRLQLNQSPGQAQKARQYFEAAAFIERSQINFCGGVFRVELETLNRHITETVANLILEYTNSGRILYLEDLLESSRPESVLQLANGLGKYKAKEIVERLRIQNYFDLQSAIDSGLVQNVLGGQSKLYKNIAELFGFLPGWLSDKYTANRVLDSLPPAERILHLDAKLRSVYPFKDYPNGNLKFVKPEGCYHIFYSSSKSAKGKQSFGDWVIVQLITEDYKVKWIIRTANRGRWNGQRIIVGRERECHELYSLLSPQPEMSA